jgi:LPXTG-motif cell wall-anchored protein
MRRLLALAGLLVVLASAPAAAQGPDYTGGVSLTCSPRTVVSGEQIVCTASGFMPGTTVSFQINPPLGTATANAAGQASISAIVPSLEPGTYSVTATGTGGDGTAGAQAQTTVDLVRATAASPGSNPATGQPTSSSGLPATGQSSTVPLTVVAVVLIVAGALLVLGVRRALTHAR